MRTVLSRRAAMIAASLLLTAAWTTGYALAATNSFQVQLTGAQEVPAVQTPGTGTADLTYDPATRIVTWSITYSGFASPVTMAHFHRGAAGRNGPIVLWLSKRGAPPQSPITGRATLTPAQAQQFLAGDWYVNLHTTDHPAGAIRGQVVPPKG